MTNPNKLQHCVAAVTCAERALQGKQSTKAEQHLLVQMRIHLNKAGLRKISQAYDYLSKDQNDAYGY